MAQDFTAAQKIWFQNFSNNIVGLMANVVAINDLFDQATASGFLTGKGRLMTAGGGGTSTLDFTDATSGAGTGTSIATNVSLLKDLTHVCL